MIKKILLTLIIVLSAQSAIALCPETYIDNDKKYTLSSGGRSEFDHPGDYVFCGESAIYCNYKYFVEETTKCTQEIDKKIICKGKDSITTTKEKGYISFQLYYMVDADAFKRCGYNYDFCTGKAGWDHGGKLLEDYSQIPSTGRQYFMKYYGDVKVRATVSAGYKGYSPVTPELIENRSDELKAKITAALPCGVENTDSKDKCRGKCKEGEKCMPNEPFADMNGCIKTQCNNNKKQDEGENCRYCEDAACNNESLCVNNDKQWVCLMGAKTTSSVSGLDEGLVFVKRWVERDVLIPLREGDRLMNGDEIVMKKWPNFETDTQIEVTWDDGKKGLVVLHAGSGNKFGSFFIGKQRNASYQVVWVYNPDGSKNLTLGGVFPKENPTFIEANKDDAIDISIEVVSFALPEPLGIIMFILTNPRYEARAVTYINVNSHFKLEPTGDGEWIIYTFEGSPEVIRTDEEGKIIDNTTVLPGYKAIVSPTDKARGLEKYDMTQVERHYSTEKKPNIPVPTEAIILVLAGAIILVLIFLITASIILYKRKR